MLLFFKDKFAPNNIPNLQAWYDASSASYLTLASTAITQMLDRSGNGNHTAVQGTGAARPTFTADARNGLGVANFDGGDTLALPSALYTIPSSNNTCFAVSNITAETAAVQRVLSFVEGGSLRAGINYSATAGSINFVNNTTGASQVTASGRTNTDYQYLNGLYTTGTQLLYVNGSFGGANGSGANEAGIDGGFIGSLDGSSLYLTGNIAEIIIYNRALSPAEETQVWTYLANKWGI